MFQLNHFHIYLKILKCIKDKKIQSWIQNLYDSCKTNELLETIQIYTDGIATRNEKDNEEKKAHKVD